MTIAALEKVGNPRALTITYHVGPDHVVANARLYSSGVKRGLMIISHAGQRQNAHTTHGAQVRAFTFLVPFRNRLLRKTPAFGTEWPNRAAEIFAVQGGQFRTVGVPSIYLQPPAFDSMNHDYDGDGAAYVAALQHWDVLLFTDMIPWSSPNPSLPLYRLLNGTPSLVNTYDSFIMHCCRSEQMRAAEQCSHTSAVPQSGLSATMTRLFTCFDDRRYQTKKPSKNFAQPFAALLLQRQSAKN